jgi:hypothetical protein
MRGLDKDFFCVHNTSFCDIDDGFVRYWRRHEVGTDVGCSISVI